MNKRTAWLWLLIRLWIAWQWLSASFDKIHNSAWVGANAGTAVKGFLLSALQKTGGAHPDVSGWYAWLIRTVALPHVTILSYTVTFTEAIVGIALLTGAGVGLAACIGASMNLNFLFAGSISINPLMLLLQFILILAWRNAGWYGLDRVILPALRDQGVLRRR